MAHQRDIFFAYPTSSDQLTLTPLGAAIVEAMPNKRLMAGIKREFRKNGECPPSRIFSCEQVEAFYRERGTNVRSWLYGVKRGGGPLIGAKGKTSGDKND